MVWRGRRFWVGMDMKVHALDDGKKDEGKGAGGDVRASVGGTRTRGEGNEGRMIGNGFVNGSGKKMY